MTVIVWPHQERCWEPARGNVGDATMCEVASCQVIAQPQ